MPDGFHHNAAVQQGPPMSRRFANAIRRSRSPFASARGRACLPPGALLLLIGP